MNLGNFSVANAAFTSLHSLPGTEPGPHMVVTSFTGDPFEKGALTIVRNLTSTPFPASVHATTITSNLTWPNTVTSVPPGAIGPQPALLLGDGFLVPGKSQGAVRLLQLNADWSLQRTVTLTAPKGNWLGGWFYHHTLLRDMNGDGRLDILTARATKPLIGAEAAEMLWLEQPASNPTTSGPWTEHVIANGTHSPGVFFQTEDLDGDGCEEITFADFFGGPGFAVLSVGQAGAPGSAQGQRLRGGPAFTTTTAEPAGGSMACWAGVTPATVVKTVVDASIGTAFALEHVDLDGDGKTEVLVTNHVNNASLSGVYAYEVPSGPGAFTDPAAWTRHDLFVGFKTILPGIGQASPGRAAAFHPTNAAVGSSSPRPLISVAGDGAEGQYILTPPSTGASDPWDYTLTQIGSCHGTAGWQSVLYDAEGYATVFFPCYEKGQVVAWSYNPAAAAAV